MDNLHPIATIGQRRPVNATDTVTVTVEFNQALAGAGGETVIGALDTGPVYQTGTASVSGNTYTASFATRSLRLRRQPTVTLAADVPRRRRQR